MLSDRVPGIVEVGHLEAQAPVAWQLCLGQLYLGNLFCVSEHSLEDGFFSTVGFQMNKGCVNAKYIWVVVKIMDPPLGVP